MKNDIELTNQIIQARNEERKTIFDIICFIQERDAFTENAEGRDNQRIREDIDSLKWFLNDSF